MDIQNEENMIDKQLSRQTSEIVLLETGASSKSSASPSPNSSPSHEEFSFTISLHSSQTTAAVSSDSRLSSKTKIQQQQQQQQPPLAIDLSPADDIFFHGHLLPLHFLSHLHASSSCSPRTSTATPLDDIYEEKRPVKNNLNEVDYHDEREVVKNLSCNCQKPPNNKSSSFSLSGFAKWVKGPETKEKTDRIKKLKFDVGQFLKRYIKMVKPLVSPKERRHEKYKQQRRQQQQEQERKCYSYSGSLSPKIQRRELRDLRGEYSAPASMRTSPTNSGLLLVAKEGDVCSSNVSDSTMDELHAAIQSAIAHCKSSTSSTSSSSTSHVKSQDLF